MEDLAALGNRSGSYWWESETQLDTSVPRRGAYGATDASKVIFARHYAGCQAIRIQSEGGV